MKRFDSISPFGQDVIDYDLPPDEFGESVTDTSHFVPSSEAIKGLSGVLSEREVRMNYDFPNGVDNGMRAPAFRRPGADLAEVSSAVSGAQKALKKQVRDAAKKAQEDKEFRDRLGLSSTTGVVLKENGKNGVQDS